MDVDLFAKQMLEKAEKRSRALGISSAEQVPFKKSSIEVYEGLATNSKENLSFNCVDDKENKNTFNKIGTQKDIICNFSKSEFENVDVGIEITVKTDQAYEVRVEVEEQHNNNDTDKDSDVFKTSENNAEVRIRDCSRNRLKRLGALYSNTDDLSSPIHRTEGQFNAENKSMYEYNKDVKTTKTKLGKLAALADSISQWEDENINGNTSKQNLSKNLEIQHVTKDFEVALCDSKENHLTENVVKEVSASRNCCKSLITKKLNWDPDVINSLEAQGFQRRESTNVKYAYDYKKVETDGKQKDLPRTGLVSGRAALFENKESFKKLDLEKIQKDPTELSLKERRQLFELNKGDPPVPKAPLAIGPSISKLIDSLKKEEYKGINAASRVSQNHVKKCSKNFEEPLFLMNDVKSDTRKERLCELEILNKRFDVQKELAKDPGYAKKFEIREKQDSQIITKIDAFANKNSERPSYPPPPPPKEEIVSNSSKRRSSSLNDENKRARNENGCLYPTLSQLNPNKSPPEEENNCGSSTISVRSNSDEESILLAAKEEKGTMHNSYCGDTCTDATSLRQQERNDIECDIYNTNEEDNSLELMKSPKLLENLQNSCNSSSFLGVNDLIDEALYDTDDVTSDNIENISATSVGTVTSNSFSFRRPHVTDNGSGELKNENRAENFSSYSQPVRSELKINEANDNMVTLVHTVSFYRRQQNAKQPNSVPIESKMLTQKELFPEGSLKIGESADRTKNLVFSEDICTGIEDDFSEIDDESMVQEKIKRLLEEVCKQQQIISQTSQALNLCAATVEFSGSTESVEGERHLLVATHRRQSCLDEIQRLRVEKSIRPIASPKEKGRLTVKEITIPLRQDYIRKLSSDTISGHHLVCLLKYNEHVLSTKTVPTLPGLLAVKFPDELHLDNVYADFRITLEIFGMTAQREILPHEVKYHINLNKKSGIKTPKKKSAENRLIMPPVQSPAGPQAVRTPALVQYGFAIFSLREIQRTSWTLTQVLGVSPLEGIIHMKVNCELSVSVEHKGFLTMFEDISGFGAWHRRWCFLNGTILNYWKYPDDEKKKAPMGSIDLYTCTSQKISVVPRDICARLNTILLECERPHKPSDKESLIMIPNGRVTTVRYLLSADTKEEREEWCAFLNKSLTLLRAWGPPQ